MVELGLPSLPRTSTTTHMAHLNINILEQLEIDETKAKSDIASLEQQLLIRKNDLVEIGIAKKRCAPYLAGTNNEKPSTAPAADDQEEPAIKRRSLGEIKRKVLEGYYSKRDEFLSNQEVATITGLSVKKVKSVTLDSKKRDELVGKTIDGIHKAQITPHGIDRLNENKENSRNTRAEHVGNAA